MRSYAAALVISIVLTSTASAGFAVSSVPFVAQYNVHMDPGTLGVTGIVRFEKSILGETVSWPDRVAGGGASGSDTTLSPSAPLATPRFGALLLGVSYDGYPDPPLFDSTNLPSEGKHLVMFMSNAAAAIADQTAFGTLFPAYVESDVIAAVENVALIGSTVLGDTAFNQSLDFLLGFAEYSKSSISVQNTPVSAWFVVPATQTASRFTVMSFSDGTQVGTGTVAQSQTPEPGSMVLLCSGLACIGAVGWLKKRTSKITVAQHTSQFGQ